MSSTRCDSRSARAGDRICPTADGTLRTCLFSRHGWELRQVLRSEVNDDQLEAAIREAIVHKELEHRVNEPGFIRADRSMSQIGG